MHFFIRTDISYYFWREILQIKHEPHLQQTRTLNALVYKKG